MSERPLKRVAGIRVRYGETDQMRYAYHAHAAFWFDVARTELLRSRGIVYRQLEEQGWILPVLALHVDYHLAAHYDDQLDLFAAFEPVLRAGKASGRQFGIRYEVRREGQLCYSGWTRHCFLREEEQRRHVIRLPEWIVKELEA
jgi:acyl-CoA thioester hydrolase